MEIGWVRISGRRNVPGRPVTYGTTDAFLEHFSLDRVSDLPGVEELAARVSLRRAPLAVPEDAEPEASADDEADDDELDRVFLDGEAEAEAED